MCSLSNAIGPCTRSTKRVCPVGDLEADRALVAERLGPSASETLGRGPVSVEPLRLEVRRVRPADVRAFVPVESQPAQAVEDARDHLVRRALDVGVLDPQDEHAAMAPRVQPVEERRAGAADVQVAGGRWSETKTRRGHLVWVKVYRFCSASRVSRAGRLSVEEGCPVRDHRQRKRARVGLWNDGEKLLAVG